MITICDLQSLMAKYDEEIYLLNAKKSVVQDLIDIEYQKEQPSYVEETTEEELSVIEEEVVENDLN